MRVTSRKTNSVSERNRTMRTHGRFGLTRQSRAGLLYGCGMTNTTRRPALHFATAILLMALMPALATAQTIRSKTFESVSPNGKVRIVSRCDGQRRACDVSAVAGKSTVEIGPRAYPSGPGIHWVNLDTAAVDFSCGEGCRTTWFYNTRIGLSAPYLNVLAVDGIRMRAAVRDERRQEIQVLPIRVEEGAAPTCVVKRDWSQEGVFTLAAKIGNVVFGPEGHLKLQYVRGAEFERVAEEIAIDRAGAC